MQKASMIAVISIMLASRRAETFQDSATAV